MLYIKVHGEDGVIIAAHAIDEPIYVRELPNGLAIRCAAHQAQGVVSPDDSQTYQLMGKALLSGDHLLAEETTGDIYEQLFRELEVPEGIDPTPETGDDPTPETDGSVMTAEQMRQRIIALENQIAEMDALMTAMLG